MRSIQRLVCPSVVQFCRTAFNVSEPAVIREYFGGAAPGVTLPALHKWFRHAHPSTAPRLNDVYLQRYGETEVPVELSSDPEKAFSVSSMALSSFIDLINAFGNGKQDEKKLAMYLAQCPVSSLPPQLQVDVAPPPLVLEAGRGDVYMSSIWIGLAPTYTPLHKDPNPNILAQLAGRKTVRLLAPATGLAFYQESQKRLGKAGSPAIRGMEMMAGEEKEILDQLVWNSDSSAASDHIFQDTLSPGDCLFIPKGWWHSVKGIGEGINGSVNWWFR